MNAWSVFHRTIAHGTMAVKVDMSLQEDPTAKDYNRMFAIFVDLPKLKQGMEDLELLYQFERSLQFFINPEQAIYCGRTVKEVRTSASHIDISASFYFYLRTREVKSDLLKRMDNDRTTLSFLQMTDTPEIRIMEREDPSWSYYQTLLYPQHSEKWYIYNLKRLAEMIQHGEGLNTPRKLYHKFEFNKPKDAESFKQDVISQRMTLAGDDGTDLIFMKRVMMNQEALNEAVDELYQLARQHSGLYHGWYFEEEVRDQLKLMKHNKEEELVITASADTSRSWSGWWGSILHKLSM